MAYVKEFHTTGVQWNAKGIDVKEYTPGSSAPAPAAPAAPAAPVAVGKSQTEPPKPAGNMFAELNKGGAITSGLKTVTKDMQTWRKEYKADEAAPAPVVPKKPSASFARATDQVKGPPKMEFIAHGAKWQVENQSEASGVVEVQITGISICSSI
jgi:adenylyl cyclase-associated protein